MGGHVRSWCGARTVDRWAMDEARGTSGTHTCWRHTGREHDLCFTWAQQRRAKGRSHVFGVPRQQVERDWCELRALYDG